MTNVLVQLGEALGSEGSLVALLLVVGGGVWIVMSVRQNKRDHDRLEAKHDRLDAKIDDLRRETRAEFKEVRKEVKEEFKEVHKRLDRILERLPPPE